MIGCSSSGELTAACLFAALQQRAKVRTAGEGKRKTRRTSMSRFGQISQTGDTQSLHRPFTSETVAWQICVVESAVHYVLAVLPRLLNALLVFRKENARTGGVVRILQLAYRN